MSKIIFTNGCFDIIHTGHIRLLEYAKSLGDYLIVGLNSDDSIKRLKGETRPINKEKDRKYILECIRFVDQVIIFEEDTPYDIIKTIMPDILVKGGDWKPDQIVGSDLVLEHGGQVLSLNFVDGYSTTQIESKIKGTSFDLNNQKAE